MKNKYSKVFRRLAKKNGLRPDDSQYQNIMASQFTYMALIGFLPAELHEGQTWFIYYSIKHPDTGELVRKRIKFNKIRNITLSRKQAKKVCHDINMKPELFGICNPEFNITRIYNSY